MSDLEAEYLRNGSKMLSEIEQLQRALEDIRDLSSPDGWTVRDCQEHAAEVLANKAALEAQRMYEGVRRSAEYMRRTQDEPNFDGPGDDDD
jgi:hypothetical protein